MAVAKQEATYRVEADEEEEYNEGRGAGQTGSRGDGTGDGNLQVLGGLLLLLENEEAEEGKCLFSGTIESALVAALEVEGPGVVGGDGGGGIDRDLGIGILVLFLRGNEGREGGNTRLTTVNSGLFSVLSQAETAITTSLAIAIGRTE